LLASKKYMYKENNKAIHQGIIEEAMKIWNTLAVFIILRCIHTWC
jgi:hypothetical protein